ncbi:MAG: outer membrane beta-barrel protein [Myxococcota bacterium]|jgi:outer membrane beta-barrel protein
MMRIAALLLALVVPLTMALPAAADRTDLTKSPPIRSVKPLRDGRHHITPTVGFTFNDAYKRNLSAGLSYRYYFNNWFGLGVDVMGTYLALDTGLTTQVDAKLSAPGVSGRPSTANLSVLAHVGATFVPLYGKMMLVGKVPVSYDVHFIVGAGYAGYAGEGDITSGGSFSPVVGIGTRWFFSEWIALQVDVRDYIVVDMPIAAPANVLDPPGSVEQNFMVTVGVSFFFPPDLETSL